MNQSTTSPTHDPYAAFRVPGLWRYFLGTVLLQVGMGAQGLAIGWDIYQRTGQPISLGLVGGVQAIPMFLLSLPAGYLADRFDRRKLIVLCLTGSGLCALGLAWVSSHHASIQLMYLLLLCEATLMTLQRPSSSSLLPMLVSPEVFENAMKWQSSVNQLSAVGGPAVGALIIVWYLPAAYLLNALFALFISLLIFTLHLKPSPTSAGRSSLKTLWAGVEYRLGTQAAAGAHLARSLCRAAGRRRLPAAGLCA